MEGEDADCEFLARQAGQVKAALFQVPLLRTAGEKGTTKAKEEESAAFSRAEKQACPGLG